MLRKMSQFREGSRNRGRPVECQFAYYGIHDLRRSSECIDIPMALNAGLPCDAFAFAVLPAEEAFPAFGLGIVEPVPAAGPAADVIGFSDMLSMHEYDIWSTKFKVPKKVSLSSNQIKLAKVPGAPVLRGQISISRQCSLQPLHGSHISHHILPARLNLGPLTSTLPSLLSFHLLAPSK